MNLHYNGQQRLHCYPQRCHLSVQLGKRNLIKCYNMKNVIENYNKPLWKLCQPSSALWILSNSSRPSMDLKILDIGVLLRLAVIAMLPSSSQSSASSNSSTFSTAAGQWWTLFLSSLTAFLHSFTVEAGSVGNLYTILKKFTKIILTANTYSVLCGGGGYIRPVQFNTSVVAGLIIYTAKSAFIWFNIILNHKLIKLKQLTTNNIHIFQQEEVIHSFPDHPATKTQVHHPGYPVYPQYQLWWCTSTCLEPTKFIYMKYSDIK